jgi:POT family proton-dependent oligopeptide transporter
LHPPGLYVLALAEACERFGFYLMLALFTLYLNESLRFSESRAFDWYGSYLSAVYFSPLIGGWLGSRLILRRSWVLAGALLLALGYIVLSMGTPATLLPALAILTVGNGLFKPNISTLVGGLYAPGDSRRDEAFGIFYMSVNIGAMIGPISGEILRGRVGWNWAFAAAGASMALSALTLRLGRHYLPTHSPEPPPETRTSPRARTGDRRRVAALLVVGALVIPFWMAYFQSGSTLTVFARNSVDRVVHVGSWQAEVPPGYFSSLGGFFVLLLTAPLAMCLRALKRRGLHLTSADKIVAGLGFAGLAYAVLCLAVTNTTPNRVNIVWLVGFYFVLTIAELLLSPVGLSLVSQLAPARWVGVLMGVWFLATSGGNKLAGQVGALWGSWSHGHFFAGFAVLLAVTAAVLATQLPWLRKTLPREDS